MSTDNIMPLRIFTGTDPGAKGAHAVMSVIDAPDRPDHGNIVACATFDLPTRERDDGGLELVTPAFYTKHIDAVSATLRVGVHHTDTGAYDHVHVDHTHLVERPDVGGAMGRGTASLVTQAINAGAVYGAIDSFRHPVHTLGWTSSSTRGWRAELGGVVKGNELAAAVDVFVNIKPHESDLLSTTDRCVAVLIAEVARRRWLGTACVPKTSNTAKVVKAAKSNRRREAMERAVAPLTIAKARKQAVVAVPCGACEKPCDTACSAHNHCCETRLLAFAWWCKPVPGKMDAGDAGDAGDAALLDGRVTFRKPHARAKEWHAMPHGTKAFTAKVSQEAIDWAIDHGLIMLVPNDKDVRYQATARGEMYSKRAGRSDDQRGRSDRPAATVDDHSWRLPRGAAWVRRSIRRPHPRRSTL